MLAKFHLAKEAFALHLLLQRFEDLVDIVVTDENLHAVFLFNLKVHRPNGRRVWATGVRIVSAAEAIQHPAAYRERKTLPVRTLTKKLLFT
jgi:hypothetical protein